MKAEPATPTIEPVVVTGSDEKETPVNVLADASGEAPLAEKPVPGGLDPITGKEKGGP